MRQKAKLRLAPSRWEMYQAAPNLTFMHVHEFTTENNQTIGFRSEPRGKVASRGFVKKDKGQPQPLPHQAQPC